MNERNKINEIQERYDKALYKNPSKDEIKEWLEIKNKIPIDDLPKELNYPVILFLLKDDEIIKIFIIRKNLYNFLAKKKVDNFTDYYYVNVSSEKIENTYIEAIIKYKPKLSTIQKEIIQNSDNYKSMTILKIRYNDEGLSTRDIKKIIKEFNVTAYEINKDFICYNKNEFEKARKIFLYHIEKYLEL